MSAPIRERSTFNVSVPLDLSDVATVQQLADAIGMSRAAYIRSVLQRECGLPARPTYKRQS